MENPRIADLEEALERILNLKELIELKDKLFNTSEKEEKKEKFQQTDLFKEFKDCILWATGMDFR